MEYDLLNRMVKRILPLGMEEIYKYDELGNMISHKDFNGNTTFYEYDSNGNLIKKTYDDNTFETYTYYANGLKESASSKKGKLTFIYDERNRIVSQKDVNGAEIKYNYDKCGNIVKVTTDLGAVSYVYDKLNRLISVTDYNGLKTTYGYDLVGNRSSMLYPNGTKAEYTYDTLNRLISLKNIDSKGDIISSYDYVLEAAGNRTKITENTGRTIEYSYDAAYKVTGEKIKNSDGSILTITYQYDKVGNRIKKTTDGKETLYTYDINNRVISSGDEVYTYDKNGNTLSKRGMDDVTKYTYNLNNKLILIETEEEDEKSSTGYTYDVDGELVSKVLNHTEEIIYLVDRNRGYSQIIEERDREGKLLGSYLYGDDLISQTRGTTTSYYHYDGLGSTRALTNSMGEITDTYSYDAFGNILEKSGNTKNDYLYTGELYDSGIGLYYLRARFMDPSIGRFIRMDAFQGLQFEPETLHKYLYADANPVMKTDPSGYMAGALMMVPMRLQYDTAVMAVGIKLISASIAIMLFYMLYAEALSGIDAMYMARTNDRAETKVKEKEKTRKKNRQNNTMRVQLQQGHNHTYGLPIIAPENPGVSVLQVRMTMATMFSTCPVAAPWFPLNRLKSQLVSGVIRLSTKLGTYPPLGTSKGGNIERAEFYDGGKEYRIDIENLFGWNLRM